MGLFLNTSFDPGSVNKRSENLMALSFAGPDRFGHAYEKTARAQQTIQVGSVVLASSAASARVAMMLTFAYLFSYKMRYLKVEEQIGNWL